MILPIKIVRIVKLGFSRKYLVNGDKIQPQELTMAYDFMINVC